MEAFMIANDRVVKGRKDMLIVILKEKINLDKLPADLKTYISKRILSGKLLAKNIPNLVAILKFPQNA